MGWGHKRLIALGTSQGSFRDIGNMLIYSLAGSNMRRWIPRSYQSVGCETTSASCWLSAQLSAKTGGRRKPSARSHHCGQYKVLFREKRWKELDKVASSCKNLNNILRASVFYTQMPRQTEASFNMKWMMTNQVLCTTPAMSESARRSLLWKSNKLCEPGWLGHISFHFCETVS